MGALRVVEDFSLDVFTVMRARRQGREVVYADLAADAASTVLSDGVKVAYASIARLVELKTGTGRAKDALDVEVLTEIARGQRAREAVDLGALESGGTDMSGELGQGEWPVVP